MTASDVWKLYNHIFDIREMYIPTYSGNQGFSPALVPPNNYFKCPCGSYIYALERYHEEDMVAVCKACGDWHMVSWRRKEIKKSA